MHFVAKWQLKNGSVHTSHVVDTFQKDAIVRARAAYEGVPGGIDRAWVEDDQGTYVCDVSPDGSAFRRDP